PQRIVVDVPERHGHDFGGAVDRDMAEELISVARRKADPKLLCWGLLVDHLRTERIVEVVRAVGPGVDRTGHEFPEWVKILERGLVRIVAMCGCVVDVGGEPQRV